MPYYRILGATSSTLLLLSSMSRYPVGDSSGSKVRMCLALAPKASPAALARSIAAEEYLKQFTQCTEHTDRTISMENYTKARLPWSATTWPMAARVAPGIISQMHQTPHSIVTDAGRSDAALLKQLREQAVSTMRHYTIRSFGLRRTPASLSRAAIQPESIAASRTRTAESRSACWPAYWPVCLHNTIRYIFPGTG